MTIFIALPLKPYNSDKALGLYILICSKGFFGGLIFGELIFGGSYRSLEGIMRFKMGWT